MTIITIPKKIIPDRELVAVPRELYKEFLVWQEKIKSRKVFKPTSIEKRAITHGRREIARGEYIILEELSHELAGKSRKYREKKS